jgi:cytoskeletal protein CcmA (bactofilin family)
MARTQFRLDAVTGSYTSSGDITDQYAAAPSGSLTRVDLAEVLSDVASAIKRIHGAESFTEAAAGAFAHSIEVQGTISGSSDLLAGGNLEVAGTASVAGDLTVGDAMGGDIFLGDIQVSAPGEGILYTTADLQVGDIMAGEGQFSGDISAASGSFAGDVSVTGDISAEDISLSGDLSAVNGSFSGNLDVTLNLDVNGTGDFQGAVNMQSELRVTGSVDLASTLLVNGAATMAAGLTVNTAVADFNAGITANELKIDGDVAQRLYIVGASGELSDEAKLTFDGSTLDVDGDLVAASGSFSGDVTVTGNLTVNGTTTTVNSTTLTVDDKNIELAASASPSDAAANGGGITLKGTTDHKITWISAAQAWSFSENVIPDTDDAFDLGSSSRKWQDLYLAGAAMVQSLSASAGAKIAGDLDVNSTADFQGAVNMQSTLAVGALATLGAGLTVNAAVADFNAGITANEIKIDSDVAQRLYIVGASGEIQDEAKLTFDGSELWVDGAFETVGAAAIGGTLSVVGVSSLAAITSSAGMQLAGDLDVNSSADFQGAVNLQSTLTVAGVSSLAAVTSSAGLKLAGDLDVNSSADIQGALNLQSTLDVAGAVDFASTLVVGGILTLESAVVTGSAGFKLAAGGEIKLADSYAAGSTWSDAEGIKLAASSAEWSAFEAAFGGEVSLLAAITAAAAGGDAAGKWTTVISSNQAANADITVSGFDYSLVDAGSRAARIDVFLNGQMMLVTEDYVLGTGNSQVAFTFALKKDDVVAVIVR